MLVKSVKVAVSCCLFAGALLFRCTFAEDIVPAPGKLDNKDVALYLVLQDIKTVVESVEKIAKQVVPPDQYQPGMAAALVGMSLGDPKLENTGGKPIVAMLFKAPEGYGPDKGPPPLAIFVPSKDTKATEEALQSGMLKTVVDDGVVIGALTDDDLAKAKVAKADYTKIAANKLAVDARLVLNLGTVIDMYGPIAKGELVKARKQAIATIEKDKDAPKLKEFGIDPEMVKQLVHLGLNIAEGTLSSVDVLQLDIALKPEGILIESTFAAKAGTLFADILTGTPPAPTANLQSFQTKGFQMMYMNLDMKAYIAAVQKALDAISADPNTAPLAKLDYVVKIVDALDAMGGETVYSIGAGEKAPITTAVSTIKDEKKYAAIQDSVTALLGKDSLFSKIYANLGMNFEMNFNKAVRQHAGVDINRFEMKLDMPQLPKEQAENIKKFIPNPEMAVTKGFGITSSNPDALDKMIDKVQKGDFSPEQRDAEIHRRLRQRQKHVLRLRHSRLHEIHDDDDGSERRRRRDGQRHERHRTAFDRRYGQQRPSQSSSHAPARAVHRSDQGLRQDEGRNRSEEAGHE